MRPPGVKSHPGPLRGSLATLCVVLCGAAQSTARAVRGRQVPMPGQSPRVCPTHVWRGCRWRGRDGREPCGLPAAPEQRRGALVPSSATRGRHGKRAPVRGRCGCGAATGPLRDARRRPRRRCGRPITAAGSGPKASARLLRQDMSSRVGGQRWSSPQRHTIAEWGWPFFIPSRISAKAIRLKWPFLQVCV
jgi:hypothetical protein